MEIFLLLCGLFLNAIDIILTFSLVMIKKKTSYNNFNQNLRDIFVNLDNFNSSALNVAVFDLIEFNLGRNNFSNEMVDGCNRLSNKDVSTESIMIFKR